MLEKLETDEINGSTENHNNDIIGDQIVMRSETTLIEEHPILLCHSGRVVREPDPYLGIGDALVAISNYNKNEIIETFLETLNCENKIEVNEHYYKNYSRRYKKK